MTPRREQIARATHWRARGGAACRAKSAVILTRKSREVDCARCLASAALRRVLADRAYRQGQAADARAREAGEAAERQASLEYDT